MNKLGKVAVALAMAFSVGAALADEPAYYVEYIQSSGSQWIDTDVIGKAYTEIEVDVAATSYDIVYYVTLIGSYAVAEGTDLVGIYIHSNAYGTWYKGRQSNATSIGRLKRQLLDCQILPGSQKFFVDGALKVTGTVADDINSNRSMYLFGRNANGTFNNQCSVRVYGCRIWTLAVDGETGEVSRTLVRDFRPCVDAEGVAALYDDVSKVIFYNKGTGTFAVGNRYNEQSGKFDLAALSVTGGAGGTVTVSESESGVAGRYLLGETVTLTATPNADYGFTGWKGLPDKSKAMDSTVTFTLEGPLTVTASFAKDRFPDAKAEPLRLYVAPTAAGKKDGSSWDDVQTDLAEAVQQVAMNPKGGEVWLKGGIYKMTKTTMLYPNVRILGGFAGTETRADQRDPVANRVIFHNDSNFGNPAKDAVWRYQPALDVNAVSTETKVYVDGVFQEPPVADYPPTYSWTPSANANTVMFSCDGMSCANGLVSGIEFAQISGTCIQLNTCDSTGFVVSDCRFCACGNSNPSCLATTTDMDIRNSQFIGCRTPVRSTGNDTHRTLKVSGCTFKYNYAWQLSGGYMAGCVCTYGGIHPEITDCTFEHNIGNAKYYGPMPVFQGFSAWADVVTGRFARCTFANNFGTNGVSTTMVYGRNADGSRIDFKDCVFRGNTNYYSSTSSACCGAESAMHMTFDGCYFTENASLKHGTTPGFSSASVFYNGGGFHNAVIFKNCTLERNHGASTFHNYRAMHLLLLNSTLNENECETCEFNRGNGWTGAARVVYVNSIIRNTSPGYVAFDSSYMAYIANFCVANSYVEGFDVTTKCYFNYDCLTERPDLTDELATTPGGSYARGVPEDSPVRKMAVRVWEGNDRFPYFYDTTKKSWRALIAKLNGGGAAYTLTDAEAAALGLSQSNPTIDDARDRRRPLRPTAGPIDYAKGMMLLVR